MAAKTSTSKTLPKFDLPAQERFLQMDGFLVDAVLQDGGKSYRLVLREHDGKTRERYCVPVFIVDGYPEREVVDEKTGETRVLPAFAGVRQFMGYDVLLSFEQKKALFGKHKGEVRWEVTLPDGIPGQAYEGYKLVRVAS